MKKTVKKVLYTIAAVLMAACILAEPVSASAAKAKCYTISSGKTTVYGNSSLTRKIGTVSGTVEIKVLSVGRKHSKISYKGSDGKTTTGYISTKAILCGTGGESCKVQKKLKAYRRPEGSSCGSVSAGTRVTVLGTKGGYTQVRYTRNGSTRYAFVKTDKLKSAR